MYNLRFMSYISLVSLEPSRCVIQTVQTMIVYDTVVSPQSPASSRAPLQAVPGIRLDAFLSNSVHCCKLLVLPLTLS